MTKRINYYVSTSYLDRPEEQIQTGDWVRDRNNPGLDRIFQVSISPSGRDLRLASPYDEKCKGKIVRCDKDPIKRPKNMRVLYGFRKVELQELNLSIKHLEKIADWYRERSQSNETGKGGRPGRTDRIPFRPRERPDDGVVQSEQVLRTQPGPPEEPLEYGH